MVSMKTLLLSITLCLQLVLFPVSVAHAGESTAAYAKALSTLVLGATGSAALTACGNGGARPSIWVFTAGSIAMIAGDMILAKSYTDYQKKKKNELKLSEETMKNENGSFQKESIEQRLSMEKEELKNIQKREILHYAMGTVMTAAMTIAILEGAIEIIIPTPFFPNLFFMYTVTCVPTTAEVWGVSVGSALQLVWSSAAGLSGGTSGAGQWFNYLTMALGFMPKITSKLMTTAMKTGTSRAIYFGANAVPLFWVAADLTGRKSVAKENIKKLEDLLTKVKGESTSNGTEAGLPGADEYNDPNAGPKTNIKALPTAATPKSCLSMSNNTASFGNSSCKNAIKLSPIDFKGGINIPVLQDVASSAIKAANDMSAGNWEGAEVSLNDINANAARIREIAEEVQNKYNEQLKAKGKPTIDFKGEIAKQVAAMDAEVSRAMGLNSNQLANTPPTTVAPTEEVKEESKSETAAVAPVMDVPAMDLGNLGGGLATEDVSGNASAKTLDESLNDYEVAENDIVKDPGVSIFKQVSNRYILNYNRFFNSAKKSLAPVEEPAAKATP